MHSKKSKWSPYIIFSRMNHNKIKKSNPNLSFGDIGRLTDFMYKKLPIEEKEMYLKICEYHNQQLNHYCK